MASVKQPWHAQVSFTERFSHLQKITAFIKQKYPQLDSVTHGTKAAEVETELFLSCSSKANYEAACNRLAATEHRQLEADDFDASPPVSLAATAIGKYDHAQHHRDGLFSAVFKAKLPHDDAASEALRPLTVDGLVALKVTTPSMMAAPHHSEREARILAAAKSDHVIPLLDTLSISGSRLVLVFPFMPLDFESALRTGKVSSSQSRSYLRDMLQALSFIHDHGIIHRDVKPSNLLLKSATGPAFLSDFGIAWSPTDKDSEPQAEKITDVGTTCYRPPELLFGYSAYGTALDLWAAGCVVVEAIRLKTETLFDSGDLGSELALILSIFSSLGTPSLQVWPEAANLPDWGKMTFKDFAPKPWTELLPDASDDARDLVGKLVVYQSTNRLSAKDALQHPFFAP